VLNRILGELKQRHVLRVGGLYVVSGWAVFQVINTLFPALNLPRWSVTLVAVLFLMGLPIVLIIAYAFEHTPDGIRRSASADLSAPGPSAGWFDWTLLAASVAIVALTVSQFSLAVRERAQARSAATPATTVDEPAAAPAPEPVANASIAVLPFVSFSDAPDGEYFADGLTEELINSLAQLPDLKVAGRTSAFYFKGRNEDLREIGRKLGVAHVLEGSVRRSGERMRVTAQLIKVADGFHIWSETYDRTLSDAFATQTEISTSVAQVLKARLLDNMAVTATQKTRDPRAYNLELVAGQHLRKHELAEMQEAREQYKQLIELEPDNPRALAGLAEATMFLAQDFLALDFDPARQESQAAIERALAIDPQSVDAWRVKGLIDYLVAIRSSELRYAELAEASFRRAVELNPNDAPSLELLANSLIGNGQTEQAIAMLQRALAIDPLSRLGQTLLGSALAAQGRFAEARRQYDSLIELYPDYTTARISLANLLIAQGQLDEAVLDLDDARLIQADPVAGFMLANCYANLDMQTEMMATLEGIREPPTAAAVARAAILLRNGEEEAITELAAEQLATTHDPIWSAIGIVSSTLMDDTGTARALLPNAVPGLLKDPPATGDYTALDALIVGYVLRETGSADQAGKIARAILADRPAPVTEYVSNDRLWTRAVAFALLNEVDNAIAELRRATDRGFRTLIDFEYFVRLEDYPFMSPVVSDPRFKAIAAQIDADNRRMRDALRARRATTTARPSTSE
jgi:TolB-like protein/Flp pilus assembly protein TadD